MNKSTKIYLFGLVFAIGGAFIIFSSPLGLSFWPAMIIGLAWGIFVRRLTIYVGRYI